MECKFVTEAYDLNRFLDIVGSGVRIVDSRFGPGVLIYHQRASMDTV